MQDSLPTMMQGEATAWQDLRPSEVAAIRHWFVESEGSYIGPVEIGEIERLWRSGDIEEQTRVWTEGMADWQPLGDLPDLMYLVLEIPQARAAELEPPTWVPAAAASLATLVQTEMQALSSTPERLESSEVLLPADLPELAAVSQREPFQGWWTEGRALPSPTPWPSDPWRYRAPARRSRLALSRRQIWVTGLGVMLLGAFVSTVALVSGRNAESSGANRTTAGPAVKASSTSSAEGSNAEQASAPAAADASTSPVPDPPQQAQPSAAATPVSAKSAAPSSPSPAAGVSAPAAVEQHAAPAALRSAAGGEAHGSRNDRRKDRDDEQIEDPATRRRSTVASPLTPNEVIAAVRPQVHNLAPCIKQARADGMLEAKQYKFILDWRIRPDGSVEAPALKGPPELLGSTIVRCFEVKMHEWSFRASAEEFAVRNFPLPVTVR